MLGTGTKGILHGLVNTLIQHINAANASIFSVDIPSGIPSDEVTLGNAVKADHVITFQVPKLSFLFQEHQEYCSSWEVVDIGLIPEYVQSVKCPYFLITLPEIASSIRDRKKHDFKGNFGHGALICGNDGMFGAAVLAGKACLKSGSGLTTLICPKNLHSNLATSTPEILTLDIQEWMDIHWKNVNAKFNSIGIGCGLGISDETSQLVEAVLLHYKGFIVLDADAINVISTNPKLLQLLSPNCSLTPHLGEFRKLVGAWRDSVEMLYKQQQFSLEHNVFVCLKGAYSTISDPDGNLYFNTTGNPGMATAGMGDVLTGLITGLLAQGYPMDCALKLGVSLHGLAGDLALQNESMETLIATNVIENFGNAYKYLKRMV